MSTSVIFSHVPVRCRNLEKIKIGSPMPVAQGDTMYPDFWKELSFISDTQAWLPEFACLPRIRREGAQPSLLTFNGHAFTDEICGATVLRSRVSVLRIETCGEMDQSYLQSCRYLLLNLALRGPSIHIAWNGSCTTYPSPNTHTHAD